MSLNVKGQLKGAQAENLTSDPTNLPDGRFWADTAATRFKAVIASAVKIFVTEDDSQTLTNKKLSDTTTSIVDVSDATKRIMFDAGGTTGTKTTITSAQTADRVLNLPDVTDTLVGVTATQTLQNKTIDNSNVATLKDTNFTIQDDGDVTKQVKLQVSGVTTGTTRTLTVPDASTTIVGHDAAQTLTNKSLSDSTTFIVDNSDNTKKVNIDVTGTTGVTGVLQTIFTTAKTLIFPDASDTLVGKATTDVLTNKSLSDSTTYIVDNSDNTKKVNIDVTGTTGVTGVLQTAFTTAKTLIFPDASDTLVGKNTTDTLTNKTLTTPVINGASSGTGVASAATASTLPIRDSNANITHNNVIENSASITTAAGTTTLTVGSAYTQIFTGSSTQTVVMPVAATLATNQTWYIVNNSTGNVTVNTSGGNTLKVLPGGSTAFVICSNTAGGTGTASWTVDYGVGTSTADVITNKDIDGGTASNSSRITLPKAAKTTLDGLTRKQGTLVFDTTSNKPYYDDGTNLQLVGSGSGGIKNYISGGDAEAGTTGWATYADAAGTSPVDGTGGSPTTTWTTTSTSPLENTNSFLFTKPISNKQGEGASYAFTIDAQDKAKVLNISFKYLVSSGTFVAGTSSTDSDVTVWVYDITNSRLSQPSNYKLLSSNSTLSDVYSGSFQTAADSTSYRLIIHVGSASASTYTLKIDDIRVSPSNYVYGTPTYDWQSYAPTINGVGTATSVSFKYRRNGDSLDVLGSFATGTVSGTTASFTLPSGLNVDSTKAPTSTFNGEWYRFNATASTRKRGNLIATSNTVEFHSDDYTTAASPASSIAGNVVFGNTETIAVQLVGIPITGWSSSVQMADQTDTRVVSFLATKTSNEALTANVTNATFQSVLKDTHNAWNGTTTYTVPVAGDYTVLINGGSSGANMNMMLYVNGSSYASIGSVQTAINSGGSIIVPNLKVGDTLTVRATSSNTLVGDASKTTTLSISRISGPNQIAATESVYAKAYLAANQTGVNPNNTYVKILFDTRDFDSHNAFDTTNKRYVAPVSGTYKVSTYVKVGSANVLANEYDLAVYKNGSVVSNIATTTPAVTTNFGMNGTMDIKLVAGDYLEIYFNGSGNNSASTLTVAGTNVQSFVTFSRIGN